MNARDSSDSNCARTHACRFGLKLLLFVAIAGLLLVLYLRAATTALKALHGPSTAEQIHESFANALHRKYDCLVMGNSRIYRGVNPDLFWCAAYNFSHDNDSFAQDYFKLKYLEQHGVAVNYLVLGVDYFEFSFLSSSRNYVYGSYFGSEYLGNFHDSLNDQFNAYMSLKFTQSFPSVMAYWFGYAHDAAESNRSHLKPNGQYIVAFHKSKEWWRDTAKRESNRLPVEEAYFEKILAYTQQHQIATLLIMPPTRDDELKSYDTATIKEFDELFQTKARQYGAHYLNFSTNKKFALEDYMDSTHLTPEAADRFSRMLSDEVAGLVTNKNTPWAAEIRIDH